MRSLKFWKAYSHYSLPEMISNGWKPFYFVILLFYLEHYWYSFYFEILTTKSHVVISVLLIFFFSVRSLNWLIYIFFLKQSESDLTVLIILAGIMSRKCSYALVRLLWFNFFFLGDSYTHKISIRGMAFSPIL